MQELTGCPNVTFRALAPHRPRGNANYPLGGPWRMRARYSAKEVLGASYSIHHVAPAASYLWTSSAFWCSSVVSSPFTATSNGVLEGRYDFTYATISRISSGVSKAPVT